MPAAAFAQQGPPPTPGPPSAAQPQAIPAAKPAASPTAKPNALTVSGYARAYDFQRLNVVQNAANPNRTAFNLGSLLKLDYKLFDTGFHIGAGYYSAYPFGANGLRPQFNSKIDNTLPGYSLSTTGQLYLAYDAKPVRFFGGDINYNAPWMPASDTRLKPSLYQGADLSVAVLPDVTLGVSRIAAFENRTQSAFERQTLLSTKPTSGAITGSFAYKHADNFVSFQHYQFYDYATLEYFEGGVGLSPASPYKPTLTAQYVNEHQTGHALVGLINNQTYGAKLSYNETKNVGLSFAFDDQPEKYLTVASTSATAAAKGVFVPTGGTPAVAALPGGRYRVEYGGIASPYSDSYATDPIYTTSITQGSVDRRSPGLSFKGTITFASDNKRLTALLSEAYYDYSSLNGMNNTLETAVDATYRFMPVKKTGPYKGLSFRERFATRPQDTLPFEFRYLRHQLQYEF